MKEKEVVEYIQQLVKNRLLDLDSYISRSQKDKKTSLEYYNELLEEKKKCKEVQYFLDKTIQAGIL